MHANDFDTRVTFERKVRTPNGGGGETVDWVEVCRRWAILVPIRPSKADEDAGASRVAGVPQYRLTVRVDTQTRAISGEYRARIRGRVLAVTAPPLPDEARGIITMHVQEGRAT